MQAGATPSTSALQGAHRRQRAAGAVAAHGQRGIGQAEISGPCGQGAHRCPGVVDRGRERVFGRTPVVQRHHRAAAAPRQLAAQAVVRFQPADDEAAAVKVQQGRHRLVRVGVQACRQRRAVGSGQAEVFDAGQRHARQVQHLGAHGIGAARVGHRQGVERRALGALDATQQAGHGWRQQMGTHPGPGAYFGAPNLPLAYSPWPASST